jgi:hypothetical protein
MLTACHADAMRWRTLLLIGALLYIVGLGFGFVAWGLLAPDESLGGGAVVISLLAGPVFLVVLGFLAGWFGRERDDLTLVAVGFGIAATLALNVGALAVGNWHVVVLVFGPAAAFIAAWAGLVTWWVGNAICELRGLATGSELVGPAYPEEVPSDAMWTTRADPALRASLDALADRIAPGAPVDARAIGVLVGFPRDRPVAVVLVSDRIAIQQVDLEGSPTGEPVIVEGVQLRDVSIRSEAADGSTRDQINAFDDLIEVRTRDGRRVRLRLPYGTRGAGTSTGGPDVIRAWLRTKAATYR